MNFQLIDSGWDRVIQEAVSSDRSAIHVVCPFIKLHAAKRLLEGARPGLIRIITRFHLGEMCGGVNDTAAFRLLLENGAIIRGIKNLHAKLYLFGDIRAIVTSANLTEAALLRNHEFGFVSSDSAVITRCREYFDRLWDRAGSDLDLLRLESWEKLIKGVQEKGSRPSATSSLPDEGTDASVMMPDVVVPPSTGRVHQSFVKFLGGNKNRSTRSTTIEDELKQSGSHWACCYPKSKRPRIVHDGDIMFMGRVVSDPNDILVYGRAIGIAHKEARDQASSTDILYRKWKEDYPYYIRVHNGEFLAGTLANGISLYQLMSELGSDVFASTEANKLRGKGNTVPTMSIREQPAVRLSQKGFEVLNFRLDAAFTRYGKLPNAVLEELDWPKPTPP